MKMIQRLIGRRQFLIATGLASGCAFTCKKIEALQTNTAMAAAKANIAGTKATANRCPNLLSPIRIRNVVLKNRIMHTPSPPHSLQGPENFPADVFRNHYSNIAKNAAIVSLEDHFGQYPRTYSDGTDMHSGSREHYSDHTWEDIPPVYNYVNRLIDDIHCEGALVRYIGETGGGGMPSGGGMPGDGGMQGDGGMPGSASGGPGGMPGDMSGQGAPGGDPGGMNGAPDGMQPGGGSQGGMPGGQEGAGQGGMPGGGPQGQASVSIEDIVAEAKAIEDQGYDIYQMNTNTLEAVQAVRSATDLIIISGVGGGGGMERDNSILHKWEYEGSDLDWQFGKSSAGITNVNRPTDDEIEQVVESAKKLEGLADIIWVGDARNEHPNSFTQDREKPFSLYYAEAIKKAGVDIVVCPRAGFHNPANNDEWIASGKMDMVCMTTPFFADPELIKKVSEGRLDDIIPCLMCHDCHGISRTHGPWYDTCSANPKWATPEYKLKNIPAPAISKKVAVIGGGPGGMKAAIIAAERGHNVTIFEKSDALGGLLKFTDHTQWKWTHKDFKDWLVNQVNKKGIEVKLNTNATPEMIRAKGYNSVLVATGAEPIISKMKGADGSNVFNILTAYSKKKDIGKDVVMIGAGRIGSECAIGMAKDGHKVTIISSGKNLIELEFIGSHNMMNQIGILQNHPNIDFILQATVTDCSGGKVTYKDTTGSEKTIQADSVVIYAGLKPMMDEAQKFIGSADQVLLLGDCTGKSGTIQKTIRNAFFVASQV